MAFSALPKMTEGEKSLKEYNRENVSLARELRKNMTPWEKKLWYQFLRTYPVRFQRQKLIGNYILDFYCAKAKLAIELDGEEHHTPKSLAYDDNRTAYLEKEGLFVLRFSNKEADSCFSGICEVIDREVKRRMEIL